MAFLMDARDHSFRSVKEGRNSLALPFVVGIPTLSIPEEEKRQRVLRTFEWITACIMALAVLAAEVYVLRNG